MPQGLRVQVPPPALFYAMKQEIAKDINLAYVIGVAIGDGNLSNPNGRAVRLRITCDIQYKNLIKRITHSIQKTLPNNKVSTIQRKDNCIDISCYSNKWEEVLGWRANSGSKYKQNISVPKWIKEDDRYVSQCLKGLFETDGSVYLDRGYKMVNFVTIIPQIASDVAEMIDMIGFKSNTQILESVGKRSKKTKYTIRVTREANDFIEKLDFYKD